MTYHSKLLQQNAAGLGVHFILVPTRAQPPHMHDKLQAIFELLDIFFFLQQEPRANRGARALHQICSSHEWQLGSSSSSSWFRSIKNVQRFQFDPNLLAPTLQVLSAQQ
jgi:hypothetical protein